MKKTKAFYLIVILALFVMSVIMFSGIAQAGTTPLHKAVRNNNKELVVSLIARGADVNARDEDGFSPLQMAPNKEMVEMLLDNGADINSRSNIGMTILHWANYYCSKELVELLIDRGADVNNRENNGFTPLHRSCTETAELLIAHGADINARDNKGRTPLRYFTEKNTTYMVDLLKKHGAKE